MSSANVISRIVRNDLRVELRSGDTLPSTILFAVLVVVLASLAFYTRRDQANWVVPGVIWLTLAFCGVLTTTRSWAREREMGAFEGLLSTPAPRMALYFGKTISAALFLGVVMMVAIALVFVLFQLDHVRLGVAGWLWACALVILGVIGIAITSTLFAALSSRNQGRDLALSIAVFPLAMPVLLAGAVATRELFQGANGLELWDWVRILLAFDLAFGALCAWLFEVAIRD